MFPNNMEFFGRERNSERFQDTEHIRLVKLAQSQQISYGEVIRKTANWLGCQLVKWGTRLQSSDVTSLSNLTSGELAETANFTG